MTKRGTILRGARILRGLTKTDVANAVGVTKDVIYRLEKDDPRVEVATIGAVAQLLKVEFDWSTGKVTPPKDLDPKAIAKVGVQKKRKARDGAPLDPNITPSSEEPVYEVPEFELSVAAGHWTDVSEVAEVFTPEEIERGLFRIRIRGDSMTPQFKDGDRVEFRCLRTGGGYIVEPGRFYYVQVGEQSTFKELKRVTDDEYIFVALNRKKYPNDFPVKRTDVTRMALALGIFKGV